MVSPRARATFTIGTREQIRPTANVSRKQWGLGFRVPTSVLIFAALNNSRVCLHHIFLFAPRVIEWFRNGCSGVPFTGGTVRNRSRTCLGNFVDAVFFVFWRLYVSTPLWIRSWLNWVASTRA